MIKKVVITSVFRTWKDKEGKDLVSKNGKKYERVSIKTQEFGDKYIGGFGGEWNKDWKEGDEETLDIEETEYNGKKYLNFKKVDMEARLVEMVTELNKRVKNLEDKLLTSDGNKVPDFSEADLPEEIPDSAYEQI